MTTTAQAFTAFLDDISPTDYHRKTLIPARHRSVKENLTDCFGPDSDMPFLRSDLIGSASSKDTVIRPIDDIDVLAVFSNENAVWQKTYRWDSKSFLYRIRNAYNGVEIHQVGARGQAVRVFFEKGGHVDVAPVFRESEQNFWLPSGDGRWIKTSPFKANKWFTDKNSELGGNLRPLVRLLKKWNREHSSRLSSYHLETIAGNVFSKLGTNRRDALAKFFEWGQTRLSVQDPGGHSGDLSSGLTWGQRNDVLTSFKSAHDRALRAVGAEDRGDHTEAKRLWRIILGDDFPS